MKLKDLLESKEQAFVILDDTLISQMQQFDGTVIEDDVIWSVNPNITKKLADFARKNPSRLKISSVRHVGGAEPTGNKWGDHPIDLK